MKYLIVTGLMRSGTTFLANFLNSQKEIMVYRDTFVTLRDKTSLFDEKGVFTSNEAKNIILSSLEAELVSLFGEYEINRESNSVIDVIKGELNNINDKFHKKNKYLGVKITVCKDLIEKLIDKNDFYIINIIRDPRDVVVSAKNRFIGNPYYRIIEWKEHYKQAKKSEENNNYINIFYEEIVDKKVGKIEELLNLKLDTDIKYLEDRNKKNWSSNSSFGDVKKIFDKKAIGRWKKIIESDDDISATQYLCKNEIKEIGYEITNIKINYFNKLKFLILYNFYLTLKHTKSFIRSI